MDIDGLVQTAAAVVIAVTVTTALYRVLPFRSLAQKKPKFTLFPKYSAPFASPLPELEATLDRLGFAKKAGGAYTRGKVYGDFSANAIKLVVRVDTENRTLKLHAPFFGILFDTGDLWQVTSDIVNSQPPIASRPI